MVHDTARKPALKDTGYTRSAFSHGVSAACCPENCSYGCHPEMQICDAADGLDYPV